MTARGPGLRASARPSFSTFCATPVAVPGVKSALTLQAVGTGTVSTTRWASTRSSLEAQKRLTDLHLDETFEDLFRFRVGGKKRLWGFEVDGVFHVLWWDAEHQVYPTEA